MTIDFQGQTTQERASWQEPSVDDKKMWRNEVRIIRLPLLFANRRRMWRGQRRAIA
jgi:hypothetical protein